MGKKNQKQKEPRKLEEINLEYNQALKELGLLQYEFATKKQQLARKNQNISELITEGNHRANLDKLKDNKLPPTITTTEKPVSTEPVAQMEAP
jgi:hypothetical protein